MAVKVRISYEKPQELHIVTELLKPIIKSCKADKGENGRFKKAYLEVNISAENAQKSVNSPLIYANHIYIGYGIWGMEYGQKNIVYLSGSWYNINKANRI